METICMACQILFSGENKEKYQFVVCFIFPESDKGKIVVKDLMCKQF